MPFADEVGRGLVARDHQHAQHVTSFHRADRIACFYLPRERAHRIGLARLHPVGQQRFEVASDLGACEVRGLVLSARGDHFKRPGAFARPGLPAAAVVLWDPHHREHHAHGKGLSDLGDPVDRPAACRALDEFGRGVRDGLAERLELRLGEGVGGDLAQARMLGRVYEQDAVVIGGWRQHARRRAAPPRIVGEALVVLRDREHVLVAREHPASKDRASVHGASSAEPCIGLVGVLDDAG